MMIPNQIAALLLGRPVRQMRTGSAGLRARRVLITGAAGSIGQALAQRVAQLEPARLTLLDCSDHGLVEASAAVAASAPGASVMERLCDVRDRDRLYRVFEQERPDLVLHAAALKYVHMGERHPAESVLTNLVGVRNVVDSLRATGGGRFVLISTDKAASPTSVMGACKRLAELYVRHVAATDAHVEALAVRFGNVFGTRGSVAPIFQRQIMAGEPVTVTHPDMERYFMLLDEAVDLILLAASQKLGGDGGISPVLLLDMGEPLLVMDLAKRMIEHLTPEGRAKSSISICGLKEGEKLSEQLHDEHEALIAGRVDGLWQIQPCSLQQQVHDGVVSDLEMVARHTSDAVVRQRVFAALDRVLVRAEEAAAG
jgi:O-antigen biosynthesis protein WbqV